MPSDLLAVLDDPRAIEAYDPTRGMQRIAVAEAAERMFARARDATQLFAAIELKLTEQRAFLRWYDAQPKADEMTRYGSDGTVTPVSLAAILGLDPADTRGIDAAKQMLSRWRRALAEDAAFVQAIEDARHRALRICEQQKIGTIRGTEGTGEFELYTPALYIEAAREVLGAIDLDPASNAVAQETVRAREFFTPEKDGLTRPWLGRVWLNPPYHRDLLPAFVDKMIAEFEAGRVTAAIMLTNNGTDTAWFHAAAAACRAICFSHGRVRFLHHGVEVAPTQGQAFFYFGDDPDGFAEVFCRIGFGVVPRWCHAS